MNRWRLVLWCLVLWGLGLSSAALATEPNAADQKIQASMVLTGTIEVAPDGSVKQYAIDQFDKLPAAVKELLGKAVPHWTFDPVAVDGKPAVAKASMSLRVVAKRQANGDYSISVAAAAFGNGSDTSGESIGWKSHPSPVYPQEALSNRVSGTVYVLVRVDRQGKVMDAVARQVDLNVLGDDRQMRAWRQVLAKATLRAVKRWTWSVPTVGKMASAPYWDVRMPVTFDLRGPGVPDIDRDIYGHWRPYIPGPVHAAPWEDKSSLAGGADAVPDGGLIQRNPLLHLRTPIQGS